MISKHELICGTVEEVCEYIENLEAFKCWPISGNFEVQVERFMSRDGDFSHIGAVLYVDKKDELDHGIFVSILKISIEDAIKNLKIDEIP
jgi:hypothetical protein